MSAIKICPATHCFQWLHAVDKQLVCKVKGHCSCISTSWNCGIHYSTPPFHPPPPPPPPPNSVYREHWTSLSPRRSWLRRCMANRRCAQSSCSVAIWEMSRGGGDGVPPTQTHPLFMPHVIAERMGSHTPNPNSSCLSLSLRVDNPERSNMGNEQWGGGGGGGGGGMGWGPTHPNTPTFHASSKMVVIA